tara:strand:- start:53355 stop:54020 length:666 start_codon:yes stop_codon:yes gene_type:complete
MNGGKKYEQLVGSRRQVFNGTAKKTGYGKSALTKKNLKMNKHGRIVSVKQSKASKKNKHLGKFLQKRGSKTFGPVLVKGGDYIGPEDTIYDYRLRKSRKVDKWNFNDFKQALQNEKTEDYFILLKKNPNEDGECMMGPKMDKGMYGEISLKDSSNASTCGRWEPVSPSTHSLPLSATGLQLLDKKTHWIVKLEPEAPAAPEEPEAVGGKKKGGGSCGKPRV